MTTDEIRTKYLKFFESKKHKVVPSDSLIPANDPTVLFTSAGMNQFKEQFMDVNVTFKRAASCQKCLRTDDLEKVGKTAGHHTFFEMLGNFSFGDYFKKEAIRWAWEFMVEELGLAEDKLWVSVYEDDDEAFKIWRDDIKIPEYKIKRYGADDNFWPANAPENGPNGPCGPCSEIFYDQGEEVGCRRKECEPSCTCDRFVEVWNLVFTQFNRTGRNKLIPLKSKNIDTGMGMERIAAVMQGAPNNFKTDLLTPIVNKIRELAGNKDITGDFRVNAIADHIRAVSFMVGDGILPSNEERGYVERMLVRRAFRYGKELGIELPFLYKLVPAVTKIMRGPYPELETMREGIADVVLNEERRFQNTLEEGTRVLEDIIDGLKGEGKNIIPGKDVFRLHDTYGFPVELTKELAQAENLSVDIDGYEKAMNKQRKLARSKSKMKGSIFDDSRGEDVLKKLSETLKPTTFLGHKKCEAEAKVMAIVSSGKRVKKAGQADKIELVLDKTPFYGEAGGQIGDSGKILTKISKLRVIDSKKVGDIIVHLCEVLKGQIKENSKVKAAVDTDSRLDIARNHTATHLLHYALREVLGKHVKQSGSLVARDRLRFDFTHFKAVSKRELGRIEEIVNELVRKNIRVNAAHLGLKEAKKKGAIALFGEKYGQKVRMISIGDYSKELCGGTHLDYTGQIGLFRIVSESSIASGMRRIEACTGRMAYKGLKDDEEAIQDVADALKTSKRDLAKAAEDTASKIRNLEKEISNLRSGRAVVNLDDMIKSSQDIGGAKVISARLENMDIATLRTTADNIKKRLGTSIVVLGSDIKGKISLVCAVSSDLIKKGADASNIIKRVSQIVGGSGGGRADFAQAGGKDVGKLNEALGAVRDIIQEELKK
jgi:alanyl-tRNA synthetase